MPHVDLSFPILGESLAMDHGYALYGAISRVLGPEAHSNNGLGIFAVRGLPAGPGLLHLEPRRSRLRIRTPLDSLPVLLKLAGKRLEMDGHAVRVGVPQTFALVPAEAVASRLVVIKIAEAASASDITRERFLTAARRLLHAPPNPEAFAPPECRGGLGLPETLEVGIPVYRSGARAGEPIRRVLRIKDRRVVGYALQVSGLTAGESILLQEQGLGGRRRMGCGLFLPVRAGEDDRAI